MKRILFILTFIILHSAFCILHSQVGINNDNADPEASAMLDIKSSDKGLLVPRMTTAQRTAINTPANGLLVFDNTTNSFWLNKNGTWEEIRKLTETEVDNFVSNNGYLTNEIDGSIVNEIQTLSLNGQDLSLSNGGGNVTLPTGADNLGDHTATQNVQLDGKYLSGDGGDEGIAVDSDGKVGIGTAAPSEKLHVQTGTSQYGLLHTDGNVEVASYINSNNGFIGTKSAHPLHLFSDGGNDMTIAVNGNVGIGTTSPAEKFHIQTASNNYGLLHSNGSIEVGSWVGNSGGYFGTKSNHPLRFFANGETDMTIATNGNVGIGTTTPTKELEVNGHTLAKRMYIEDNNFASIHLKNLNYPHEALFQCNPFNTSIGSTTPTNLALLVNGNDALTIDTDYKVGIGTTTPAEKLHVQTGTSEYGLLHTNGNVEIASYISAGGGCLGTKSNHPLRLYANGGEDLTIHTNGNTALNGNWLSNDGGNEGIKINNSGNVGIGATASNIHFSVTGNNGNPYNFSVNDNNNGIYFAVESDGDLYAKLHNNTFGFPQNVVVDNNFKIRKATSSRRYKKNIRPAHLDADVEKFLSLEPKAFQFKEDPRGIYDYGFIAEEVAELGLTNPLAHWEDGKVQSIYFDHIAFYNFAAIKQHRERIVALEKRLSAVQVENEELLTANEELQAKLEKMEELEQRLARLEAAMQSAQTSSLSAEVKSGE